MRILLDVSRTKAELERCDTIAIRYDLVFEPCKMRCEVGEERKIGWCEVIDRSLWFQIAWRFYWGNFVPWKLWSFGCYGGDKSLMVDRCRYRRCSNFVLSTNWLPLFVPPANLLLKLVVSRVTNHPKPSDHDLLVTNPWLSPKSSTHHSKSKF